MARVPIPQSVYERASQEGRGSKQMRIMMDYLTPLIAQGDEIKSFERDKDGNLFAVTGEFIPSPIDIPPQHRRKPRR